MVLSKIKHARFTFKPFGFVTNSSYWAFYTALLHVMNAQPSWSYTALLHVMSAQPS